jgi:hypothetical protein
MCWLCLDRRGGPVDGFLSRSSVDRFGWHIFRGSFVGRLRGSSLPRLRNLTMSMLPLISCSSILTSATSIPSTVARLLLGILDVSRLVRQWISGKRFGDSVLVETLDQGRVFLDFDDSDSLALTGTQSVLVVFRRLVLSAAGVSVSLGSLLFPLRSDSSSSSSSYFD